MKRLAQFLLILSCTSYAYDDPMATKAAIDTSNRSCIIPSCINGVPDINSAHGPRGRRGHRGKKGHMGNTGASGATGAAGISTSCGLNELFANAAMIFDGSPNNDAIGAACPYNMVTDACMPAFPFIPSTTLPVYPLGFNFDIPIDLDVTEPVTLVVFFLVANSDGESTGSQVNFQVSADYKSSDEVITGVFAEIVASGDFTVTEPVTAGDFTLFSSSVSLNPSLMATGDWAFLSLRRIAPASNEYSLPILLTAVSFRYTKICS